ncbi:disulfide bond formation protein B [Luteimonas sp. A277]
MKTPRSRFRTQMLAAGAICFVLIGFAIFSQLQWGLDPCPLCIFQRLAFAGLGVVLLAAGVFAPGAPWGRRAWSLLAAVAAGVGIAISGRHVWLQLFPPPIPACGPPLDFLRETLSTGHLIRRVLTGTGDCGAVDWTFLGLSMPMWALTWFLLLGAWALYAGFSRSR